MVENKSHEVVDIETKLSTCKEARAFAAQTLHTALKVLLVNGNPISELILASRWHELLTQQNNLLPEGWYMPPPHGIGVLFGTEDNYDRMNYKSLRPLEMHPQQNIFLDKQKGIVYLYASPVHKKTGMIGDFGLTIYFGRNENVIRHLQTCLSLNHDIFQYAQAGITFADVTQFAAQTFREKGLTNEVASITDPTGVNIGHTVPASYEDWPLPMYDQLFSTDYKPDKIAKIISSQRKFLNTQEQLTIRNGMAFTMEPRLTVYQHPEIPMSSYHTIVLLHTNGTRELLTNFKEIFELTGMSYMV